MTDVLLVLISSISLLVGIATLTAAILALRSSRRSEEMSEDRTELLREQRDRLELLREERHLLKEELERERRGRLEDQRRIERLELQRADRESHKQLPVLHQASGTEQPKARPPWWRRLFSRSTTGR